MPTTTPFSILSPDFPQEMVALFFNAIEEGTMRAYRMYWDILMSILAQHWMLVIGLLFLVFIMVSLKAMSGQWGSLGSFLYNFFYFGTLFIVGLIWGPEVFAGDLFKFACTALLYPICYILSGLVMNKMGVRRQ